MVAAYYCFRQADTGEISDFPRYGYLDTPPTTTTKKPCGFQNGLGQWVTGKGVE